MSSTLRGTTSNYFNNNNYFPEQELLEDLIIESISIYGTGCVYIPRVLNNYDALLTEDDQSSYGGGALVALYINSIDGFTGDGEFLSKFGVEIRDQVTFSISRRIFSQEITSLTQQPRPNEGDLIYFPQNRKCFQIKYTDKFDMFYQLGGLQLWRMTCELFEYSGEKFNTGYPEIDNLYNAIANTADPLAVNTVLVDGTNNFIESANTIITGFDPTNPFSEEFE